MSFSIALCLRCRSSTSAASRSWSAVSLSRSAASLVPLGGVRLAQRDQFAEIADQPLRARAHLRHDGAEQHRRAQRLQRILGPHHQRRRRAPAGALQRRQHLGDLGAARVQRVADLLLAAVERAQPRLGVADARLDAAHCAGDVDQLLIELVAVLADRGDLGLQLLLGSAGALLLRARRLEFLLVLLDDVVETASPAAPALRRGSLRRPQARR